MNLPYTYILTHLPTGKQYYGVRYANKTSPELDLWRSYFSSSPIIHRLIQESGVNSFTAKVDKVFKTAAEAIAHETKFISNLALPQPQWLNANISGAILNTPEINSRKSQGQRGRIHSEESKQKRRVKMLAYWSSPDAKLRHSKENNHFYGKSHSAQTKEKLSQLRRGKPTQPHSEATKAKMSEAHRNRPKSEPRVCPHCGTVGRGGNMTRYHFNKCPKNTNQSTSSPS